MNNIRNNTKKKKLLKINKKMIERNRDNIPTINNLCLNAFLILSVGIFSSFELIIKMRNDN